MTTPLSVHSMGCATYISQFPLLSILSEEHSLHESSVVRWKFGEAVRAKNGKERNQGVVSQVHKITGEHAACARAYGGEYDAHKYQYRDQAPGPAKLCAMHQPEQDAREDNTRQDSERARK